MNPYDWNGDEVDLDDVPGGAWLGAVMILLGFVLGVGTGIIMGAWLW